MPPARVVSIQTTSERGGAEYAHVDLLDALLARGHDVVLLTNAPDLAVGTRVRVHEIDIGPKLAWRTVLTVLLRAPQTLLRLARALRSERPVGVTLLHFKKEQLLCSLLPRRLTGEVVWFEWGPMPLAMRHRLPHAIYALIARRARRIVAVSEGTRQTIVEAGVPAAKVVTLPDLVNLHTVEFDAAGRAELRQAWGAGEDTLVIGCVSRFQRRKRYDVVIDAMADLDGDVLLVLAGEGEEEQQLRARAAPHGERVRFVPNVRGHVEAFLSACDLLAYAPSPTEADRPRVIVMAQLVGVPVVATHSTGASALRPPGAGTIVHPHHDPVALAAALAVYRDDPERRRREAQIAGRAIRESHDPQRTLVAVEDAMGLRS